jgi:hypothetical protein
MSTCEKDYTKLSINIEAISGDDLMSDIYTSFYNDYYPDGVKEGTPVNPMLNIKTIKAANMINSLMMNSKPGEDIKLDMCVANKCVNKTPSMVMIDTSKKYKFQEILPRIDNNTIVTCYNNVSSDIGPDPDSIIHKCSIGVYDKTIGICTYAPDFYFPQSKSK